MYRYRPVIAAPTPFGAPAAIAEAAVQTFAPAILTRGGPYQRAANLVARGETLAYATETASAQGKGHMGELMQSVEYSARAGSLGNGHHARPNPIANDPRIDVQVLLGRRVVVGSQLKVGTVEYVWRAYRSGNYWALIANAEARDELLRRGWITEQDVRSALEHEGVLAGTLTASRCKAACIDVLTRMLMGSANVGQLEMLALSARAGTRDGIVAFSIAALHQVAQSFVERRPVEWASVLPEALRSGARAAARSAVQTRLLLEKFVRAAGTAFADKLVHRIASSALLLGAVSEVVVETAIDLVAVVHGGMTWEELLRRAGVHVCTAAGAALGVALVSVLTGGLPFWITIIGSIAAGYAGGHAGRAVGQAVFMPPPTPTLRSA
jgi:hypothetical protein